MYTSYFCKRKQLIEAGYNNLVSISISSTTDFNNFFRENIEEHEYKKLAPKYWMLKKYKDDGNEQDYIKSYYREILDKITPNEVLSDLGDDAVLMCWESPEKFCHRKVVSDWLLNNGIYIREITF